VVERLRVFRHVGFFLFLATSDIRIREDNSMEKLDPSAAQQIARAAIAFQNSERATSRNRWPWL